MPFLAVLHENSVVLQCLLRLYVEALLWAAGRQEGGGALLHPCRTAADPHTGVTGGPEQAK